MPLYDFQCEHCQTIFEVRATFKEKEAGLVPECPQCHKKEARQLLSSGLFLHQPGNGAVVDFPSCSPNAGPGCCG